MKCFITNDIILCYYEYQVVYKLFLWVWWLATVNGIQGGWQGCDWLLASANGILNGWPGWIDY